MCFADGKQASYSSEIQDMLLPNWFCHACCGVVLTRTKQSSMATMHSTGSTAVRMCKVLVKPRRRVCFSLLLNEYIDAIDLGSVALDKKKTP